MAKLIACAGQGVELSGVPTEIKILPLGRVHSQKGDFNVDDESFELIRKQFKDRSVTIDTENLNILVDEKLDINITYVPMGHVREMNLTFAVENPYAAS